MELIRQAYADFLTNYNWDYFFTATFRSPRREPYYAMKSVWSEVRRHGAMRSFMGVEPFLSGDLHIHGLLAGWSTDTPALGIDLPWEIWKALYTRFGRNKVEMCNSRERVTSYCAKYILKGQSSASDHYEFFGESWLWREGLDKV